MLCTVSFSASDDCLQQQLSHANLLTSHRKTMPMLAFQSHDFSAVVSIFQASLHNVQVKDCLVCFKKNLIYFEIE